MDDQPAAALPTRKKIFRRHTSRIFTTRIGHATADSDKAWAATIRRTRHVGDFTRRENYDSYAKAFERLLRDLKAEA